MTLYSLIGIDYRSRTCKQKWLPVQDLLVNGKVKLHVCLNWSNMINLRYVTWTKSRGDCEKGSICFFVW